MTIDARCLADNTINIVTVSGGKDSLADWLLAIENGIPFRVVFADTRGCHDDADY
jgi:3'-phosphoadenosine 5'-phosphosulfate sulfotransferase (PAPS reductase)/FAD synthetase